MLSFLPPLLSEKERWREFHKSESHSNQHTLTSHPFPILIFHSSDNIIHVQPFLSYFLKFILGTTHLVCIQLFMWKWKKHLSLQLPKNKEELEAKKSYRLLWCHARWLVHNFMDKSFFYSQCHAINSAVEKGKKLYGKIQKMWVWFWRIY